MTIKLRITTGLLLLCMACSNVKETPKGFQYTVVRKGDGKTVKVGEFLIMDMMFKDSKDSVWYDTRKGQQIPATTLVPDTSAIKREEGVEEIFRLLSKGDSITFTIPSRILFDKTFHQPIPPAVDPKGNFFFSIGVRNVVNKEGFTKMQQEIVAKQNEKFLRDQKAQIMIDSAIIDNYLKAKNVAFEKSIHGVRYVVDKAGTGPKAIAGQRVDVAYAGYLLNGKCFDTSSESVAKKEGIFNAGRHYEPYSVVVGEGSVIQGWEELFPLMNKGTKVTAYIPSPLAYGTRKRSEDIVENSILVFNMEMVDIK
jgi:FKBP-type peptidyl-prolyl cis-trans isomerase FkpA